ncbi:hypothetical protein [Ornithinimicrobium panacihumi]|jgi:hypothetical protein|uniref:hypothetical protein n=1 Tax=Ornithinimicrobium panacihumi TaxID=2008449 RepID=UPI003F89D626
MTITSQRRRAAHHFHRRHNTLPLLPMPPVERPWKPARHDEARVMLADLTSPWAYLVHLRLAGTGDEPAPQPAWWAVCGASSVPLTGLRGPGPERERLREELEAAPPGPSG